MSRNVSQSRVPYISIQRQIWVFGRNKSATDTPTQERESEKNEHTIGIVLEYVIIAPNNAMVSSWLWHAVYLFHIFISELKFAFIWFFFSRFFCLFSICSFQFSCLGQLWLFKRFFGFLCASLFFLFQYLAIIIIIILLVSCLSWKMLAGFKLLIFVHSVNEQLSGSAVSSLMYYFFCILFFILFSAHFVQHT